MREEIKQLISKLDEPYALPYYKGVPICDMNCEELRILCAWLVQIHYKGENDSDAAESVYSGMSLEEIQDMAGRINNAACKAGGIKSLAMLVANLAARIKEIA